MKIKWGWIVAGILAGWIVGEKFLEYQPGQCTCGTAKAENRALEQCLKFRPSCEGVTTEQFVVYYDNKDWLDANCPAHSGDGFLSQQ